jgi:hypothetical protein
VVQRGQWGLVKKSWLTLSLFGQETLIRTLLQQKKLSIKQGTPVEKKQVRTAIIISALLFSTVAGTLLIQNGQKAFIVQAETAEDNTVIHGDTNANVTIQSPENKVYNENNVILAFTIESDILIAENVRGGGLPLF